MELNVTDSPKMLREKLCLAQYAVNNYATLAISERKRASDALQELINECDRHRPLGSDGKHGNRHTPTCGCEDNPEAVHSIHPGDGYPSCWPQNKDGQFKASRRDNEVTCVDCLELIAKDNAYVAQFTSPSRKGS